MQVLEDRLNRKLDIVKTVLFGHLNCSLTESKQLIPFIKDYYNIVWSKVSKITGINGDNDIFPNTEKSYKIKLTSQDFSQVNTFFNALNITIDLTVTNKIGNYKYSGGYDSQKSLRDCLSGKIYPLFNGEKLPVVNIVGEIETSVTTIQEAIAALVYHEFTHAYEDLQRIKKGNKENSMAAYSIFSNYNGINTIINTVPEYGKYLGNVIYLLKQIERNAYVSQAIGEIEIKTLSNWSDEIPNIIESTSAYKNYETLLNLIDGLSDIKDIDIQNNLLIAYNTNAGIVGKYNGKNVKYSFKTYRQMIKWLKKKTIYNYNKFVDKLSRHFEDIQIRNKFLIH